MDEQQFYTEGGASLVGVFDSMEEFMNAALNPPKKTKWWQYWINGGEKGLPRLSRGETQDWYGFSAEDGIWGQVGTAGICKLVSKGWVRGTKMIEKAFESIQCDVRPVLVRRRRVRSDQGDSLDIHAVYRGNLETAWDKCVPRTFQGPQRVTIVNDALDFGSAASEKMFWRGAAVCALADKLVRAGYSVRVVSGWKGGLESGQTVCRVEVKSFTAPLDLATLAAGVALPAFFRSIGHTWGCGWAEKHNTSGFHVYSLTAMPGEVLMSNRSTVCDAATASAWVVEQINALQVPEQLAA